MKIQVVWETAFVFGGSRLEQCMIFFLSENTLQLQVGCYPVCSTFSALAELQKLTGKWPQIPRQMPPALVL